MPKIVSNKLKQIETEKIQISAILNLYLSTILKILVLLLLLPI
jgi:hypothetical protein